MDSSPAAAGVIMHHWDKQRHEEESEMNINVVGLGSVDISGIVIQKQAVIDI